MEQMDAKKLVQAVADLEEEEVKKAITIFAQNPSSDSAKQMILACQQGMEIVGERFASNEYFLAELIFAAEIVEEAMKEIQPHLTGSSFQAIGSVVLGTVEGDVHDIGKNIAKAMLQGAGFEVVDLGVNVPIQRFVEEVRRVKPQVVGLSGLLTSALEAMINTVDALKEAGLRDQTKIIIGGNPVTEAVCRRVGADAYTTNAAEGAKICKEWVLA